MITSFEEIYEILRSKTKKRLIAAWAVDDHTITAAYKAVELGIVEATLVGDINMIKKVCEAEKIDPSVFTIINNENELASIAQAVLMVREGQGDILMKGLCSTDKYMRGILNKEKGLLPPKAVLSHVCVLDNPNYRKLIILGDMAVIPLPDLNQKVAIVKYLVNTAKALQIEKPKVALLAATEQMLPAMQACVDAAIISKMIDRCLLFPNIESANTFYKVNSQLCKGVKQAAIVAGAMAPCVLSSRADSIETKLNSIALAALTAK